MVGMCPRRTLKGFTLIELLTVLVVLVVTLWVATPMFGKLLHGNQLHQQASRLLGTINLARSQAVMRNSPVSICPSAMALTGEAVCSGTYAEGWIVFSNVDKDKVIDVDSDQVLQVFEGLPRGYQLTNRKGTRAAFELISFLPDGSSRSNRTLLICPPQHALAQSLSVVINIVGRARLVKEWGECPVS